MPSDDDTIIIRGYKDKVSYYGLPAVPAWVFIAVPILAFIAGLLLG